MYALDSAIKLFVRGLIQLCRHQVKITPTKLENINQKNKTTGKHNSCKKSNFRFTWCIDNNALGSISLKCQTIKGKQLVKVWLGSDSNLMV